MTTRQRAGTPANERTHARRADVLRSARSSAAEQVAESVRWMIVDGVLRPGQKIAQEVIALELGVSRVPVREALIQMERDGLVVSRPNVGAFVAPFDESVIRDHFEVVGCVQSLAAERTAAARDRALLARLEVLRDALARESDPLAANALAVEFQRLVNRGCGSSRLRSVLRGLSRILPVDIFVHIPGSVRAQQEAISAMYTAIATRKRIQAAFLDVARKRAELIVDDLRKRGTFETVRDA